MNFYNILKEFPGIYQLRRLRYRHEFHHARWANLFDGVYSNFATALKYIPRTKPVGYNHPEPAKMYKNRMAEVYPADYPVLYWLFRIMVSGMKVFDLGGHTGVSYYAYQNYLPMLKNVSWQIYDVPAVVDVGKRIAHKKSETKLSFTTDFKEADGSDILLASGSLQYLEDDISHLLSLLKQKPLYLLISMLPLHPEKEFVTIQNIGTAFCPYRIFQQENFIRTLADINYELIDKWENAEKKCLLPFHKSFSVNPYQGLYFRLKES